ncbi:MULTISPECIES: ABC transporter substrate-binding protein [Shewanella]|uniref:ABC transporter substrate-binding protein n=1 Tax=Shewanella TaxID=22 RepID=UPI003AAB88A7
MILMGILGCVTGCDVAEKTNRNSVSKKKAITIAVSNTPLSAPFFIAEKMGFFANNNLHVKLERFDGGVKCFNALVNQQVDFATASETVVMFNSFQRTDFAVMASFVESDNDVKLLSLTPEKYRQLDHIANTRIGVIKGSASEFFLDSLLIMHNKTHLPIKRVYLTPAQLIPALLDNQVDIISAWEPLGYMLLEQIATKPEIINSRGLYHLSFNLIGMKQSTVDNNDKQALLKSISEAIIYIHKHPKHAQEILSKTLNIAPSQLQYSWADYTFRLSLSNALFSNIQTQSQWAIDNQLVPKENRVDFRQVIDRQLLETFNNKEAGW